MFKLFRATLEELEFTPTLWSLEIPRRNDWNEERDIRERSVYSISPPVAPVQIITVEEEFNSFCLKRLVVAPRCRGRVE
jgi:hypothetical protein